MHWLLEEGAWGRWRDGIDMQETCGACPEQYDVYVEGEEIAYIRLRHGYLSVRVPDPAGEEIFGKCFGGDKGCFTSEERDFYLPLIQCALFNYYRKIAAEMLQH
jgi:hypothetical protein